MKVYIDTNVYIDFLKDRSDKFRPLGEFAAQVFQRSIGCEFFVVFSDHVYGELNKIKYSDEDIKEIIEWIDEKMIIVKMNKEDILRADEIVRKYKIHYQDALHYAIALRTADVVLTNDNYFKNLPNCKCYETI